MKELDLGIMGSSVMAEQDVREAEQSAWCAACALCAACGGTIATWSGVAAFAAF